MTTYVKIFSKYLPEKGSDLIKSLPFSGNE